MATVFKTFLNNDIKSTRTLLHEAIPLTGALVSGTYGTFPNGGNIKNYSNGMFQSVYDYPYLSSSANHIYDLTVGISNSSSLSASTTVQRAKKINMYNQMSAVLMGYDASGNAIRFDRDGDLAGTSDDKMDNVVFINFARLLQKDEIKKGSFQLKLGANAGYGNSMGSILTVTDAGANTSYKVNAAAGEYGILSCSLGGGYSGSVTTNTSGSVGLIFYQAGVAVLSSSILQGVGPAFVDDDSTGVLADNAIMFGGIHQVSLSGALTGTSISGCADSLRHRIQDISFNNTTELNSTIHFCRLNNTDFNYSANPSYLSQSQIRVKNNQLDAPVSYMTTVGLYSADNELLAVAKVSEPLKKDPTNEMIVRVRLDY